MNHLNKYILSLAFILIIACKHEAPPVSLDVEESAVSDISINQKQFTSSKFEIGKVEQKQFYKTLQTKGSIHIPEKSKASVNSLISGTVGAINLLEGQWVAKGQKLFTVTNPELINLQEEYLIAKGKLEYLTEEYNLQLDLSKEYLTTKKDLLKSKSELNTTQARYGALRKKLDLYGIDTDNLNVNNLVSSLSVNAPISGYIAAINVTQGRYIDPNYSAVTINNTSQIYLELEILEKDAMLLEKGQKVSFKLQDNSNTVYQAYIHLIDKSINEKHIITVNCKIEGDTKEFVPGMFVYATLFLEDYTAHALPESALVKLEEKYYGLMVKQTDSVNITFDKEIIEIGEIQNGYIEVKEPINPDMEFLTKGSYFIIQ